MTHRLPLTISRHTTSSHSQSRFPCLNHRPRPQNRTFHITRILGINDHYATLGLQSSVTTGDIKKSFYTLSKTHHPDRNPDNQREASKKFMAISEAYHVLGDAQKRQRYDAELQQFTGGGGRSYSSSSRPASGFSPGARKAGGLSRRRGTFHGPPPSFYRSGGWGGAGEKRSANTGSEEAARRQQQEQRQQQGTYGPTAGPHGGSTGGWPFTTDPNDVGHFDREGHFKTQSSVEEQLRKGRRKRRRVFDEMDDMVDNEGSVQAIGKFLMVCGTLAVGLGLPAFFLAGGAG